MVDAGKTRILLDCGMFQGRRDLARERNQHLGFDPKSVNAVCLSHAHIDHSGALPMLAKGKFKGNVHMTSATADLTEILLADSARIQESDCRYVNKLERRRGRKCISPIYSSDDAQKIVKQFQGAGYTQAVSLATNVTARFHDAGHIIGSSAIWLQHRNRGNSTSLLFSGDLGRANMPILRDPSPPPPCDVLIIESTYGDRLHRDEEDRRKDIAKQLVQHAIQHKSKIIVPAEIFLKQPMR